MVITRKSKKSPDVSEIILGAVIAVLLGTVGISYFPRGQALWPVLLFSLVTAVLLARTITGLLIQLNVALVLNGVFITLLTRMSTRIPQAMIFYSFLFFVIISGVFSRKIFERRSHNSGEVLSQILLILFSYFLVARWPLNNAADYLSFLSFEDNAAWISTVAANAHSGTGAYAQGVGGPILDPLMVMIYWIEAAGKTVGSSTAIYQATAKTYAVLQFLGIVTSGLLVFSVSRLFQIKNYTTAIAAFASTAISYILLQQPTSTGHLTFIGALIFIWVFLLVSTTHNANTLKVKGIQAVLIIGVVGMWWPFVAVLVVFFLALISENWRKLFEQLSKLAGVRILLIVALVVGGALVLGPILANHLSTMSIREFLTTSGGITTPPGYLAMLTVVSLLCYLHSVRGEKSRIFGLLPILSLGVLVVILYFASVFVGPTFSPRYTYLKTFLLFTFALAPLVPATTLLVLHKIKIEPTLLPLTIVLFAIGNLSTGWDINSPKSFVHPVWADQLIAESEKRPNALILCHTSDPSKNLESYICSRHSAAIQGQDGLLAIDWRFLQLDPNSTSADNLERAERLAKELGEYLRDDGEVILLSFEKDFQIPEEDQWWMKQIPVTNLILAAPI